MEDNTFKNYVYVSANVRANLEEILSERKIYQVARFINTYDVEIFFREQLKNLKGVNFLIFDLSAFPSSSEDEIIKVLKLIREFYECRIIIIAEGHKQGDVILSQVFNLGIYNIITATNDIEFEEQLKKTLTIEGMTFGSSLKYHIDEPIQQGGKNTIIKENYIKVKQLMSIGIASTEKHSGATSLALNLAKYILTFDNTTCCYIENNSHEHIKELQNLKDCLYLQDKKMLNYNGLDLFLKPTNIAEIQKYDYSFYIYDFGNFDEMTREVRNNFLSRDLKIIVSGSQIWEEEKIADCLSLIGDDLQCYLFINKTPNERKEEFKKSLPTEWQKRTFFSEDILNPFEIKNQDTYKEILTPYLINQNIVQKEKKGFLGFFKGGKK